MAKRIVIAVVIIAMCCAIIGCKAEPGTAGDGSSTVVVPAPEVNITVPDDADKAVLTVTGQGEYTLTPDMAVITAGVTTTKKNADDATNANTEQMNAIIAAIKALGIADEDIRTENYSVYEEYDYDKEPAQVVGYTVNNSIVITVRDLSLLGTVMADAVANGATDVFGPIYQLSDGAAAYENALAAAVGNAQGKALAIAEAAGVTLSSVPVSISEASYSTYSRSYNEPEAAAMETSDNAVSEVPVSEGTTTVTANVTIVYEIG